MLIKTAPARVKAAGKDDGMGEGQFSAVVSVFGNRDSYGDVVVKGAFTQTLADWKASGDPIPVYWSHRMDDPDFNIGEVLDAKETDTGLEVLAQLDLEGSSKAASVHRLLKGRRVTQFSFAYDVIDGAYVEKHSDEGDQSFYELRELKLYEVGPTPIGANQETDLLGVKSSIDHVAQFARSVRESIVVSGKAGRTLSAANAGAIKDAQQQISAAAQQLADVLEKAGITGDNEDESDDAEKASASQSTKGEDPAGPDKLEESAADTTAAPKSDQTLRTRARLLSIAN